MNAAETMEVRMELNRLNHISVDDDVTFTYNNDVMRRCFGSSATQEYGQYAVRDTGDGCFAWFPKERKLKNGKWVSGTPEVNWKNHLENDGLVLISELNPDEKPKDSSDQDADDIKPGAPSYTFFKREGEPYKYVGTFLLDVNSSTRKYRVCRRISTEIDLQPWYDQVNLSYLQGNEKSSKTYKKIYIEGYYPKQKKLEEAFLKDKDTIVEKERHYLDECNKIRGKYPLASFRSLNEGNLNELIADIEDAMRSAYGDLNDDSMIGVENLSFNDIAGGIISLIAQEDHNKELRESPFGALVAGRVMALFNPDYYLYSISEDVVDFYLQKLKICVPSGADLTEKHCLLYFWKQCNNSMDDWSPYWFKCFLESVWDNPFTTEEKIDVDEGSEDIKEDEAVHEEIDIEDESPLDEGIDGIVTKGEKEGKVTEYYVTKYERNPRNRKGAIKIHGYKCMVCGFDFEKVYGEIGKGFIEVHHVKPLYDLDEEVVVNPETDLVCVCANCHRMIHKKKSTVLTIEELRENMHCKPFLSEKTKW